MKRLIVLLGVAGVSLSAVFVRWSTAPSLILALYRMAFSAGADGGPGTGGTKAGAEIPDPAGRAAVPCQRLVSGHPLRGVFWGPAGHLHRLGGGAGGYGGILCGSGLGVVSGAAAAPRTWPAVLLTFAGSTVVALADSAAGTNALLGDLIALAGAAAMAVYTMIGTVCRQRLSTSVYTFLVYTSATATLLAAALLSGTPLAGYGPVNGLTALGMAVCCTLLGHNVFSWGLKYLPPAFIATVKLMEPVFASVWGLLLFGERPAG